MDVTSSVRISLADPGDLVIQSLTPSGRLSAKPNLLPVPNHLSCCVWLIILYTAPPPVPKLSSFLKLNFFFLRQGSYISQVITELTK